MKMYGSPVNRNYTGPLVNGAVWSENGVAEIPDNAENLKLVLEVFHQYSVNPPVEEVKVDEPVKPKVTKPVKEAVEAKA